MNTSRPFIKLLPLCGFFALIASGPGVAWAQSTPSTTSGAASTSMNPPTGGTTTTTTASGLDSVYPIPRSSSSDVEEHSGKTYYFVGLRYRGDVIPKFLLNIFVNEGKTIYSNTLGVELDMRKDGFSFVPALSYTEYGTGDILFSEKNKDANLAGNWSLVNSSLKSFYLTADLLWSTKVSRTVDIEYGAGFGIGLIFGDLETTWVYENAKGGDLQTSGGRGFSRCVTESDGVGCRRSDHQNSSVAKVNRYVEPSWVDGGSRPNVFPWISFPQFGVRIKPAKEFQTRIGLGLSLTGLWFGISGNYGLEKALSKQ